MATSAAMSDRVRRVVRHLDDCHLEEAGHIAVAAAVEARVRQMLT